MRIELTTAGLQDQRSATELRRHLAWKAMWKHFKERSEQSSKELKAESSIQLRMQLAKWHRHAVVISGRGGEGRLKTWATLCLQAYQKFDAVSVVLDFVPCCSCRSSG